MNTKNIVLASDNNYAQHLAVTLISLLENNKDESFNIFIFDGNIEEISKSKIAQMLQPYKCHITYLTIDDTIFKSLYIGRLSIAAYYRLLMTEYIHVDKLLYLDVDIIVNNSIKELYDIDISDFYAAAVIDAWTDHNYKKQLGMDDNADYFNSGMMLVNLKKWRSDRLFDTFMEKIQDKNLIFKAHDQDILNLTFNGKWKHIELKYNQYEKNRELNRAMLLKYFSKEEVLEAQQDPIIIHYIGGRKPWHYRSEHVQKALYWKYLKMTPFKDYKPTDKSLRNIISKNTPLVIRNPKRYFKSLLSKS